VKTIRILSIRSSLALLVIACVIPAWAPLADDGYAQTDVRILLLSSVGSDAPAGAHSPCSNHIPSTSGILAPDF
jgi:hypothetical protein